LQKKEERSLPSKKSETVITVAKEVASTEIEKTFKAEENVQSKHSFETPKKRKKKKTSYKNMMAGMMSSNTPSRDIKQEKEGLRKVTGGGAFSKIDKI